MGIYKGPPIGGPKDHIPVNVLGVCQSGDAAGSCRRPLGSGFVSNRQYEFDEILKNFGGASALLPFLSL